MNDGQKISVDWDRIELEFRAGIKTLREIANPYNISHVAISKRAKREGWERDLSAKIKSKALALVNRNEVNKEVNNNNLATEREIIEVNAQMQATALLNHRKDISRYKELAIKLLAEIETETDNQESFSELAEVIIWRSGEDGAVQTKEEVARMARMQKLFDMVMSNPGRVDSLKKLSETMKNLIGLERQALGLSDDYQPDRPKRNPLKLADFYGETEDASAKSST